MKKLAVGILAHVDAGKTTLSEAMLYCGGLLRQLGRVDHKNAYLDTDAMEKERGITIFSKQAVLALPGFTLTLLDTPGHVDFSGEMERTLRVLDQAILVISGTDGIQSHTLTVWKLLEEYHIPTVLFLNKMDQPGADKAALMEALHQTFGESCVDFTAEDPACLYEAAAVQDEALLEEYLDTGALPDRAISQLIAQRKLFPCWFGSALRLEGIEEFLNGLQRWLARPEYPPEFGARVFKIARDPQGARLTYLKVTGGCLKVKDILTGSDLDGEHSWQEKADQIRIYSGAKFTPVDRAEAGTICAVTGLTHTWLGQGLGRETASAAAHLQPVMSCALRLPQGCDPHSTLQKLAQLEEEDPLLHIAWNERTQQIQLQMMGEMQLDILKQMIFKRFHLAVGFEPGQILYRETIAAPVEGIGHFEPLRHYAEVHLLMEPLPSGSGLQFATACSEDKLDKNWQRLILTHLAEREHPGVLTGSPITDLRITLVAGRAHPKHTEGGDFRQATYRAVRQGLMQAQSVLLEPWYAFSLEVPTESVGRAITDIQRMGGSFAPPQPKGDKTILAGQAPVSAMRGYPLEVSSYTHGSGRISCDLCGYRPCHNTQEVMAATSYEPERDTDAPVDSVFCSHGAGFIVPWYQVPDYAHVNSGLCLEEEPEQAPQPTRTHRSSAPRAGSLEEDAELAALFEKTYGPSKRRELFRTVTPPPAQYHYTPAGPEYLLVDGYNVLFSWEDLKDLARSDLGAARQALVDILCNYQGFKKCQVILVFDAYKVPNNSGDVTRYHNIFIVYTRKAETADMYIEKTTYQLGANRRVRVVTSDGAEQLIILGHGALRVSASMFRQEVEQTNVEIRRILEQNNRY